MNLLLLSPGPCDNKITWSGTSMNLLNAFRNIETIEVSHVNMYSFIPFIYKILIRVYRQFFFVGGNNTRNRLCYPMLAQKVAKYIAVNNQKGWNLFIADHASSCLTPDSKCAAYIDADYMVWAPKEEGRLKDGFLKYYDAKTKESLENMAYIFTMNEWTREFIIKHHGIEPNKVFNVGFGINVKPYFGDKDYSQKRMLIVLRKGREKMKGLYLLLEAMELVKSEISELSLDVVGTDVCKDNDSVRTWYNYPRSKTAELFEKSSLYVMPSEGEPNGITYLEALANKTPIVGLNGFAFPEFAGQGKYGFIAKEATPRAVADKIIEAFENIDRLRVMGEEGQKYVLSRLSWESVTRNMYNIMKDEK